MTELTWETSTDWDNAASEDGVVHESTANTDHDDATIVKQGYPFGAFDEITPTPARAYPLHEDSGSTANDLAGTDDGSITGATLGATGILGTTAYDFDGSDDFIEIPTFSTLSAYTVSAWVYNHAAGDGNIHTVVYIGDNQRIRLANRDDESNNRFVLRHDDSGGSTNGFNDNDHQANTWYHYALTWDGSTLAGYKDGSQLGTESVGSTRSGFSAGTRIGDWEDSNHNWWDGKIADVRVYDTALSSSEISALYDVVDTAGTLTTATKTS